MLFVRNSKLRMCSRWVLFRLIFLLVILSLTEGATPAHEVKELVGDEGFGQTVRELIAARDGASGAYVLERGDEALLARGWMLNNAEESIDIMTLIWSLDRIGLLATEMLLQAADRGVTVRILVDDITVDASTQAILLPLSFHPRIDVRIYNPTLVVGVSPLRAAVNVVKDFRLINQRLHNKSFIMDGVIGITGGRNMSQEYFDYNQEYNFRDRDILVAGPVAGKMRSNFEEFWNYPLARPIEELLRNKAARLSPEEIQGVYDELIACSVDLAAQTPVIRESLADQPKRMARIFGDMLWNDIDFISDSPWKNKECGLHGGGEVLWKLTELISEGTGPHYHPVPLPYSAKGGDESL